MPLKSLIVVNVVCDTLSPQPAAHIPDITIIKANVILNICLCFIFSLLRN